MSMNLRLGYGMAMVYGFTPHRVHSVMYDRNIVWFPTLENMKKVLGPWRDQYAKVLQSGHASGSSNNESRPSGENDRAD